MGSNSNQNRIKKNSKKVICVLEAFHKIILMLNKKRNGILLQKLFWPTVRKTCPSDREKLLKFEAEGQEFANLFKQWKVRTIFGNRMLF